MPIMIACIFMFGVTILLGDGSTDVRTLLEFGANSGYYTRNGEFFRLFTCIFLHAGILHLFFNMYSLYIVGPQIESFYGKLKYIFIFAFSGICGSILS